MASKRRYKIGLHPVYDKRFDRFRINSQIINSGNTFPSVSMIIWDKGAIALELKKLQDEVIPSIANRLRNIDNEFARYQKMRVAQGYSQPTQMTIENYENKMVLEAQYDVCLEEAEDLEKKLESYLQAEQREADTHMLEWGLNEVSKLHGLQASDPTMTDCLKSIDGQKVEFTADGVLIINDEKSPYSGMAVSDYREMAKEWRANQRRKEMEKFKLLQQSYAEQGLVAPSTPHASAPRKVARGPLPKWPDKVRNYLLNQKVTK